VRNLLYGGIRDLYFGIGGPQKPHKKGTGKNSHKRHTKKFSSLRILNKFAFFLCTLCAFLWLSKLLSHTDEVGERGGAHFLHHQAAMKFDSDLTRA
jgi:hypothetical protein